MFSIYKNKTVLVTGHTGFKGSWLSIWLTMLGAKVVGYSLDPYFEKDNFNVSHLSKKLHADIRADILDSTKFEQVVEKYQPEIIFHLAAQALVKLSYQEPKSTYEVNVIGSLNILEAARKFECIKAVVMVTSDKCYENLEQIWGYKETDRMGGYDPYSSSKGCAEILISSYRNSFFNTEKFEEHKTSIASVRAGNVIGGGDWSENRLIPDCVRFIEAGDTIKIRSPKATRPWQHVLEPLSGYLTIGAKMFENPVKFSDCYNFGPYLSSNKSVWEVVQKFIKTYGKGDIEDISNPNDEHEAGLLNVDITKAGKFLDWEPVLSLEEALEFSAYWYKQAKVKKDMYEICVEQIKKYSEKMGK